MLQIIINYLINDEIVKSYLYSTSQKYLSGRENSI